MKFASTLLPGTLIKRYRRSLADVQLDDGGVVTAHCPAFGPMKTCLEPGRPVMLSDSKNQARLHPLTWELIDMNGSWVCVNPAFARKLILEALQDSALPALREYEVQTEATYGKGKSIDIILQGMEQNCFVNVYSVTWVEDDIALFPDSANVRAVQSLNALAEISRQGHRAIAYFVIQRGDCSSFKPAEQVDRAFLKSMLAARSAEVEFVAYRAAVTPEGISLGTIIPCILK